jgi:hypothetical protein
MVKMLAHSFIIAAKNPDLAHWSTMVILLQNVE